MADYRVTFLKGGRAASKKYGKPGEVESYPRLKNFVSNEDTFEGSHDGMDALMHRYRLYGRNGSAMLKGSLTRPLKNESRKGLHNKDELTRRVVLDFDNIQVPGVRLRTPITETDVAATAEALIEELPEFFHHVSYIAHASNSFALREPNRVSMHVEFWLKDPVKPSALKLFLENLNLTSKFYLERTDLGASGLALSYPIDICTADNSRIIYIAPPQFNKASDDPFPDSDKRFVFLRKTDYCIDLYDHMPNSADVQALKLKVTNKLRTIRGLKRRSPQYQHIDIDGESVPVMTNPDRVQLSVVADMGDYVRYNVNGGDSGAYWVHKFNPVHVFNFKGEPAFSFQLADPDAFNKHVEMFVSGNTDNADKIPPRPFVFFDYGTDHGHKMLINPIDNSFIEMPAPAARSNMDDYMRARGGIIPDPIPFWNYTFDPSTTVRFDPTLGVVNSFQPTHFLSSEINIKANQQGIPYGEARGAIRTHTPSIYAIIWSMVGCDLECFNHFVNWFAHVVQNRTKAQTAWMFHGVQGTGKTQFFEKIAKPILGAPYTHSIRTRDLEDSFNGYLRTAILIAIEEFRLWDAKHPQRIESILKNLITEETVSIRAMRSDLEPVKTFNSIMMNSNSYDILNLDLNDRRFNIAPRQEVSFRTRFKNADYIMDQGVHKELPLFAQMMRTFKIDAEKVRVPLTNIAKTELRESSRTSEDTFAQALREGDLEYFLQVLETEADGSTSNYISTAKRIVKYVLRDLEPGEPMFTSTENLATLYKALFGKRDMTAVYMGRKLARWGLSPRRGENRKMGLLLHWDLTSMDQIDLQQRWLEPMDFRVAEKPTPAHIQH